MTIVRGLGGYLLELILFYPILCIFVLFKQLNNG